MGEWIYNSSFDTVMDFAVTVDNVFKRYGQVEALQGVSLSVRPGELFGIIGPDGAYQKDKYQSNHNHIKNLHNHPKQCLVSRRSK